MTDEQHVRRRTRRFLAVAAVLLVVVGAAFLIDALSTQRHPPQPPLSAAQPLAAASGSSRASAPSAPAPSGAAASTGGGTTMGPDGRPVRGPILARSQPTSLRIPSIGVTSSLLQLGLNPDHSVQVPPLDRDSKAGWYKYSPTPGQLGPSVILGHVDSAEYGPGIFFKLGAMRPGDQVEVTRADRTTAVFRVDKVVSYPKNSFPTLAVYGNTDNAQLRLITCGGKFDFSTHNYLNNIVVYASLVSSRPA